MKESIKKRIEAVRHGEVPEGYTRTDSGVMPEEWPNSTIGKIIVFHSEKSTINNQYPVLTSARSGLALQTEYFEDQVTREENAGYNVIPRGYVTYRSRSDDGRFIFNQNQIVEKGIVSCFYPVFRIIEDLADPTFVLSYLNNYLGRQIMKEIVGTSQLVLSEKKLSALRLPCPPLAEQQKIAEILATCDRVIELKRQLLAEKRQQKQWLMQKLLDPNSGMRMPGFECSKWMETPLTSICKFVGGGTPDTSNEHYWNGTIPWISSADLQDGNIHSIQTTRFITEEAVRNSATRICPKDSILIISRVGVGKIAIAPVELCTSQDFTNLVDVKGNLYFITHQIQREIQRILAISQGTSIKGIASKEIKAMAINLPSRSEQDAIAKVLECSDREISLCGAEIEAWQQKKKALMQLLLTGLVRVNA